MQPFQLLLKRPEQLAKKKQKKMAPKVADRRCSQCGVQLPTPPAGQFNMRYLDQWVCSRECGHAAGDRSGCLAWDCGCTRYAKKRRLLREHRLQMRVMQQVIYDNQLEDEAQAALEEEGGDGLFFLGTDSEMDEASDVSDPEQELRAAAADQSAMVQAVQGALECRGVLQDMERARMQLEDVRSGLLR